MIKNLYERLVSSYQERTIMGVRVPSETLSEITQRLLEKHLSREFINSFERIDDRTFQVAPNAEGIYSALVRRFGEKGAIPLYGTQLSETKSEEFPSYES